MSHVPLSDETVKRLRILFPGSNQAEAERLLVEDCGSNLPFCEKSTSKSLERLRFAALKLSGGRMYKLVEAIVLAQIDWRDLLMDAGFGTDVHAHERWMP